MLLSAAFRCVMTVSKIGEGSPVCSANMASTLALLTPWTLAASAEAAFKTSAARSGSSELSAMYLERTSTYSGGCRLGAGMGGVGAQ